MEKKENLYYALGHFAYAVALSDGSIQNEERKIVHKIVVDEVQKKNPEMNISEIIFNILQKQNEDIETTLNRGKKEFSRFKGGISSEMKADFIDVLYKVAEAFPPIEQAEEKVINDAKAFFETI